MVVPLPQAIQTGDLPFREPGQGSHASRVTILMCTYNGERFLSQQLDSIARQSFQNWDVVVSDDGSTDATLDILRQYAEAWGEGKLTVRQGPKRGFAANFLSLACVAPAQSDFYAWADQDDIWQDAKLDIALKSLQHLPTNIPALYCARTELIDDTGMVIGCSPLFARPASFANALVQSLAGGNTMVFNRSAQVLFQEGGPHLDIVSHDWWAYLLVTGTGGQVVYDPAPTIFYRQHDTNLIGSDMGARARLARLRMMFSGRFKGWNQRNIIALESVRTRLSKENQLTLDLFNRARKSRGAARFLWLRRSGVYRQTVWGSLGLMLAAAINRI
ncbi:glycosyltransferase family 2 protein [Pseudomonas iranensis]|uniref:glycosyltransferase family 2 protein n=1 Tax=Pseudomonas iranensis TaxID=2745503 RepID=UPI001CEDD02D|nr:glycosyltransferase family 2 protein [Pseudomonas iranensis]